MIGAFARGKYAEKNRLENTLFSESAYKWGCMEKRRAFPGNQDYFFHSC